MAKLDVFDHYSFRARLQPAFLALLPMAICAMSWTQPGAKWVTALWSLLTTAGFTFFLSNVARNRGKQIESKLWEEWGGAPTVQLLRHKGSGNPALRERWHEQLSKLLGKRMPSPDDEERDPTAADVIYEAATKLLIGKTYDAKAYPFVYRDNVNYGFCRNMFGLRLLGIVTSVLGAGGCLAAGVFFILNGTPQLLPWAGALVCIAMLLWWIFTVTKAWVKVPATNYANHLFAALEKLPKARTSKKSG